MTFIAIRPVDQHNADFESLTMDAPPIMYVDHFQLKERTFTNGPATGYFSPNAKVETAVARIRQTLLARDSVAVVTGGPGVGKSAIVANAIALTGNQTAIAHIDLRQTNPDLLYDMLLLDLGADTTDGNEANSLHCLRQVIAEHNEAGRRVTAVIDITGMTIERAKRILQLVHMAGEPGGQLNIILLGPHALHKILNAPGLIHLRQRVCFRYRARPLTPNEVEAYMRHHFELAGGDADSILDSEACNAIFRYASGVPRLINTLMDTVLSEACIRELDNVSPVLVNLVARELGWKSLTSAPRPQTEAAESAADPKLSVEAPEPAATDTPAADGSGIYDIAELLSDPAPAADPTPAADPEPDQPVPTLSTSVTPASDPIESPSSSIPLMNPDDTSATGMLRLEDLDARFAETIFGDEELTESAEEAVRQGLAS
jgi:type II secretory pathway predicted ATPase ExeA